MRSLAGSTVATCSFGSSERKTSCLLLRAGPCARHASNPPSLAATAASAANSDDSRSNYITVNISLPYMVFTRHNPLYHRLYNRLDELCK